MRLPMFWPSTFVIISLVSNEVSGIPQGTQPGLTAPEPNNVTAIYNLTDADAANEPTNTPRAPGPFHPGNQTSTSSESLAKPTSKASAGTQGGTKHGSNHESSVPAQPALLPAVHWDRDTGDLQNLSPANSQDLYYTAGGISDPYTSHVFARLATSLSYPSIVLEHSKFVQSVHRGQQSLLITLANAESFSYAKSNWPSNGNLFIITNQGGSEDSIGQRTFFLVNGIAPQGCDTCIKAVVEKEVPVEEALQGVDMSWGTFEPPSSNPSGTNAPGGNHTNSTCGLPPAAEIDGFPTAPCGSPNFDKALDDKIGYLDFSESHYGGSVREFAAGLKEEATPYGDGFGPTKLGRRASLQRRWWFFDDIVEAVSNAVAAIGDALQVVGEAIVDAAVEVAQVVSDALAVTPEINLDFPIDLTPSGLVDSPWGPALQLLKIETSDEDDDEPPNSKEDGEPASDDKDEDSASVSGEVTLYCVRCGVTGEFHLFGRARWTILDGLSQANVGLNGNIDAGVELGIDASAKLEKAFTYPIAQVGAPGFSIPGIITIGPEITLDAEIELGLSLAGQVLAGVRMSIPNFDANIDLVDGANSTSSGFTPQFEKIFEAKAEISATAGLGLPLGVGIGIDIPAIKWRKTASINDKPAIEATFTYTGSTTCEGITDENACVNGISYDIQFKNDIYADLFGLKRYDLYNFAAPIASDCIKVGPQPCPDDNSLSTRNSIAERDDPFSYVDTHDLEVPTNDANFQSLSAAAQTEVGSENRTTNGTEVTHPPDSAFINITDIYSKYSLASDPTTGAILTARANDSTPWAEVRGIVAGDEAGRYLHYYKDTMNAYNVSRLRLTAQAEIAKTAESVTFVGVDSDKNAATPDLYAAVDTVGNVFVLITCDYANRPQTSRIFLARSPVEGPAVLEREHLRYTVTGGVVSKCYHLPYVAPMKMESR